jgi:hypothetical protein
MRIDRHQVPSVDEVEEKRGNLFFEKIRAALQRGDFENQRVTSRPIEKQKAAKRGLSRKRQKPVEPLPILSPKPLRRGS